MSWAIKTLNDLCEIKLGKTPSRKDKKYWDVEKNTSNVWVSIADLTKLKIKEIYDSKEYISNLGASLFKPVAKGTLLMSFKLSIGKLAFAGTDLYTNEAIVALPIKNELVLSKEYLYYYLQFFDWDKETENDVKLKGKTLNKEKLKKIQIPLPPLATQQKIVEKLDAIFAEIERATLATEANVKNAEALFQSYLTEVFNSIEYKKSIKELCVIKPPKSETKKLKETDLVSFMPMEALGINQKNATANQTKNLKSVAGSYTYFANDDVLMAKITPCFENGKLGIARELVNGIGFGSSEYVVFRTKEMLNNEWLYYFLSQSTFRNEGAKHMSGAVGHKRVTKEFIENTEIPLPNINEQLKFVRSFDSLKKFTSEIAGNSNIKLNELIKLKQSILKQAFNGELVKE